MSVVDDLLTKAKKFEKNTLIILISLGFFNQSLSEARVMQERLRVKVEAIRNEVVLQEEVNARWKAQEDFNRRLLETVSKNGAHLEIIIKEVDKIGERVENN